MFGNENTVLAYTVQLFYLLYAFLTSFVDEIFLDNILFITD